MSKKMLNFAVPKLKDLVSVYFLLFNNLKNYQL